ncbi:MAG: NADH-ubiquinone oxidoreductase-F iron-sulfur binding region domain-containing protein [Pseudomonadota bacterium]
MILTDFSDLYCSDSAFIIKQYENVFEAINKCYPKQIIEMILKSKLSERSGAGFLESRFRSPKIDYLIINAKNCEPRDLRDKLINEKLAHLLISGIIILAYSLKVNTVFIYADDMTGLSGAIEFAYKHNYLGNKILKSRFSLDIHLYNDKAICISEKSENKASSLSNLILKPAFYFENIRGKYKYLVHNSETVINLPWILLNSPQKYIQQGNDKQKGTKLFSVTGSVNSPGLFEKPYGYKLMDLINDAGGFLDNNEIKGILIGGVCGGIILPGQIEDLCLGNEELKRFDATIGSGNIFIISSNYCAPFLLKEILIYYSHESCGTCTPCREGTRWAHNLLDRIIKGEASLEDLDQLLEICENIAGKTICTFPVNLYSVCKSIIQAFREEFIYHISYGKCDL